MASSLSGRFLGLEPAQDQGAQVLGAERAQPPQRGPAQQGRVHLEERVLGGGPDEHHQPVLHGGQEHVLLGLVEAVHLVDEEHGALAVLAQAPLRLGQRLADVLDSGRGGREGDEVLGRGGRQQPGQRGLACAGRPPQDGDAHPVALGQGPQRRAGPDEVLLAHHLVERAGSQPGGQRSLALQVPLGGVGEQAHSRSPTGAQHGLHQWLVGLTWAIPALTAVLLALTIVLAAR